MTRPAILHVGGILYWVIRTYDANGVLVDADSTPTVAVRKMGSPVGDSVTVTKRAATTGIYDCSYNPAGEVEGEIFTIEETAVIAAVPYPLSWEVTATTPVNGRIPATLVGGRMDSHIGAFGNNTLTSSAAATSFRDAISQRLSGDIAGGLNNWPPAVTAIQAGLATQSLLSIVATYIDTEIQTLLNRITGVIRTASEDVVAESAQNAAIRLGLATTTNVTDATTQLLTAIGDIDGASGGAEEFSLEQRSFILGRQLVSPPDGLGFEPPVNIYRFNDAWFCDLVVEDYQAESSISYYLSPSGNDSNSGLSALTPKKSLSALLTTLNASPPTGATLYLAPGFYSGADSINGANIAFPCNIICPGTGRAFLGGWSSVNWAAYNAIFQTAYAGQTDVALIDMVSKDSFGNERRYRLASSLADCESTVGTHWISGGTLYVNPFENKNLTADQDAIAVGGNGAQLSWNQTTATKIYMEGICFWGNWGMPTIITSGTTGIFTFNRCSFSYAVNGKNGLAIDAAQGNLFVCKNVEAVYNQLDGLNWDGITLGNSCTVVEVDCVANYNGFGLSNANDNGSTCHKGVKIIRVNGTYQYNHDRNVHDIESVRSWNIGCIAGPAQNSDPDAYDSIAWCFGRSGNTDSTQAWLYGCSVVSGSVAELGVYGNAVCRIAYMNDLARIDGNGTIVRIADEPTEFTEDLESLLGGGGSSPAQVWDYFEAATGDAAAAKIADQVVPVSPTEIAEEVATRVAMQAIRDLLGSGLVATDRTVVRGTTWRIAMPFDVPATWDRMEFTVRQCGNHIQARSMVWIRVTNPADDADGLQVLAGSVASDATDATIVTEDVEAPIVLVQATATQLVGPDAYAWDCKLFVGDEVTQEARGTIYVEADVTRTAA